MSIYELTSVLEDRYLPEEIVELLDNINKDDIRDYAVKNMVCPKCYKGLVERSYKEDRGQYFGMPVKEEIKELICDYCDWVDD